MWYHALLAMTTARLQTMPQWSHTWSHTLRQCLVPGCGKWCTRSPQTHAQDEGQLLAYLAGCRHAGLLHSPEASWEQEQPDQESNALLDMALDFDGTKPRGG